VYLDAKGVPRPLTQEQKTNLANNERYVAEQWMRARNKVAEDQKARLAQRRKRNG
jgi:uncharacterized protein YozE (UPF0346 family)